MERFAWFDRLKRCAGVGLPSLNLSLVMLWVMTRVRKSVLLCEPFFWWNFNNVRVICLLKHLVQRCFRFLLSLIECYPCFFLRSFKGILKNLYKCIASCRFNKTYVHSIPFNFCISSRIFIWLITNSETKKRIWGTYEMEQIKIKKFCNSYKR